MTREEAEDAKQELYITMIKCLKNYQPQIGSIDAYVTSSLKSRVRSFCRDNFLGRNGTFYNSKSLHDKIIGYEDVELIDTVEDLRDVTEKYIDAKILSESLLRHFDADTAAIVRGWMRGCSLTRMAKIRGVAPKTIFVKIQRAIADMRDMVVDPQKVLFDD